MGDEAVSRCGRYAQRNRYSGEVSEVSIMANPNGAHFAGVMTCGSVWMCPVCGAKIAAQRRGEITGIVQNHAKAGGTVAMATFTIPHTPFQQCKALRTTVAGAFRKLLMGPSWKRQKDRHGIAYIRALEVTHGDNGWHPHLHVLFFLDHAGDLDALGDWIFARWQEIVKRLGFGTPSKDAWDWKIAASPEGAAEYITKIAGEMTYAHMKEGRNGGRSPFQILADYAAYGDERDAELFREYARAFKGARQLTSSGGLHKRYAVEIMDDPEAAMQPESDSELIATITGKTFEELVARDLDTELLKVVEKEPTWQAVERFLRQYRMAWGLRPPPINISVN